ncbi:hypothetical protein ACFW04_014142 [Cataglyphis niger]
MTLGTVSVGGWVDRGCSQSGVLSSLLWCLMIDGLLSKLNDKDFFAQGYAADDLAICGSSGLSINSRKTELIIFTRKYKLTPDRSVKYFGVILHKKLIWKEHLEDRNSWDYEDHANYGNEDVVRIEPLCHTVVAAAASAVYRLRCKGKWRAGTRHTKLPDGVLSHPIFSMGQDKMSTIRALKALFNTAFKALETPVTSKLVWDCRCTLGKLARDNEVALIWVPGHFGIRDNEAADQLARADSELCWWDRNDQNPLGKGEIPLAAESAPGEEVGCRQAKVPLENSPREDKKPGWCILTGHGTLNYHLHKFGISMRPNCRKCDALEEISLHVLCNCLAYARIISGTVEVCFSKT